VFWLEISQGQRKKCNVLIENEEGQFLEHGNFEKNFLERERGKIGKICWNVGNGLRNILAHFNIPKTNLCAV
jgi:hypothetical protein